LLTDFTYDNIGLPKNPQNPWYGMPPELNPAGAGWVDLGLGEFLGTRPDFQAFASSNQGKQKVPTLRNVDLRPSPDFVKAYGHNGYFKTLEGIVHFYNTRDVKSTCPGDYTEAQALAANCWPAPEVSSNVNRAELGNLRLTAKQERAIVAFLKTLSDGYVP
jgi:cytochrome c peroxidase